MAARERRDTAVGLLMITPQVLGTVVFVAYPLVMVVWYSTHQWNVLADTFRPVGLGNYRQLAHDPVLPSVLRATAGFSAALVVLNVSLGLFLAVLLNRRWAGTTLFRTAFFSPVVVSVVAWTLVWRVLLQDNGGINGLLALVGVDGPNWLRGDLSALTCVVLVQLTKGVGLSMVLFLAALQGVPPELVEAARIDGASWATVLRRVIVPMISPTILLASIITVVGSLQAFAQIAVLTQGGPGHSTTVLVYYLYQQAFQFQNLGYGSTLAVLLFVIMGVLTLLQWRLRRRWVFHES